MEKHIDAHDMGSESTGHWNVLGHTVPKSEVVFFVQVLLVYIVVIVSIVNLTINNDHDKLWTTLLSSSIGYLLPNPTLKRRNV